MFILSKYIWTTEKCEKWANTQDPGKNFRIHTDVDMQVRVIGASVIQKKHTFASVKSQ